MCANCRRVAALKLHNIAPLIGEFESDRRNGNLGPALRPKAKAG
jgi:hypothetical protein